MRGQWRPWSAEVEGDARAYYLLWPWRVHLELGLLRRGHLLDWLRYGWGWGWHAWRFDGAGGAWGSIAVYGQTLSLGPLRLVCGPDQAAWRALWGAYRWRERTVP